MLSSSTADEVSHESERLGGSFFTHHLVSGLQGAADTNGDGQVTLPEVYRYSYAATLRSSGRTASLQHPTYAFDVKGKGELVLARLEQGTRPSAHLFLTEPATYLVVKGGEGGEVLAEVRTTTAATHLALPPGAYFVQQREPDHYREYRLELGASARVHLAEQPHQRIAYARLVRKGGGDRRFGQHLTVLAAGRGPLLDGQGPLTSVAVGYGVDFPWASLEARLRGGSSLAVELDPGLEVRHLELGAGVLVQRLIDLSSLSLGLAVSAEWILHHQSFDAVAASPAARTGAGFAFSILACAEAELGGPLRLRAEVGPTTALMRKAETQGGVEVASSLASGVTLAAAVGLGWGL
jgi:hypothetical protein